MSKYATYGSIRGWKDRMLFWFYCTFRSVFWKRPYVELDLEGKKTDLFWRRFNWRMEEQFKGEYGKQLMDNIFAETPLQKYIKRRGPAFYLGLPEITQDTVIGPASSNAGGLKQKTTNLTY